MLISTWNNIAQACNRSVSTVRRWHREQGFPAAPLPNGEMTTTQDLINQWILARAKAYRSTRQTTTAPGKHQSTEPTDNQ